MARKGRPFTADVKADQLPANQFRFSVNCDTVESDLVQRQDEQIVQSELNLWDFLP